MSEKGEESMEVHEVSRSPDLFAWLASRDDAEFPKDGGGSYKTRAATVFEIAKPYLEEVLPQNIRHDGGYLTHHGPEHIKTVLRRASDLLTNKNGELDLQPYEVHLLVMAAIQHDLGNASGREGHEARTAEVMSQIGRIAGSESVEQRTIRQIAAAHGGKIGGSKDTIANSGLERRRYVLHKEIRPRVIAAVLRFADELADDFSRASAFLSVPGVGVPAESEVFHHYARALHSVAVVRRDRYVALAFHFHEDVARRQLGKGNSSVYLLDEIHDRTLKMHRERIYCTRFWESVIPIEAIQVTVEVDQDEKSLQPTVKTGYSLRELGYPTDPASIDQCVEGAIGIESGEALVKVLDEAAATVHAAAPKREGTNGTA